MELRERNREERSKQAGAGSDGSGGGDLAGMREQLDRMMAAGDRAIEEVLSGDSEGFLQNGRQQGGQ